MVSHFTGFIPTCRVSCYHFIIFLHACSCLEAAAVYEMKLVAFNGNGESDCSKRLVSLGEGATSNRNDGRCPVQNTSSKTHHKPTDIPLNCMSLMSEEKRACQCSDEEASLGSVVIGIHIGTACIIFCVLFLVFGYRHRWAHLFTSFHLNSSANPSWYSICFWSLFCSKGSQGSWSVPRNGAGHDGVKDRVKHLQVEPSLQVQTLMCIIEMIWNRDPPDSTFIPTVVQNDPVPELILIFSLCCCANLPMFRRSVHHSVRWSSSTLQVHRAKALANTGP